jgi:hypothetical protein
VQDARRLDTVEEERVSSLAPAPNDHQESDALSDLRPLSSGIAVVHDYPGAAFAGRPERARVSVSPRRPLVSQARVGDDRVRRRFVTSGKGAARGRRRSRCVIGARDRSVVHPRTACGALRAGPAGLRRAGPAGLRRGRARLPESIRFRTATAHPSATVSTRRLCERRTAFPVWRRRIASRRRTGRGRAPGRVARQAWTARR